MLRRLCLSLMLPAALALAPSIGAAAAIGGQNSPQTLLIRQSVGQPLKADVGAVAMSNTGYGLTNTTEATLTDLPQLPQLSTQPTDSQDTVMARARSWVAGQQPGYSQQLGAYMRRYGLTNAWLLYRQTIPVYRSASNDTVQMRMSWTLSQDQAGRASFGDPHLDLINAGDARILHVSYKNRGVTEGLHPAYAFSDGGYVRWQLFSAEGDALSGAENSGVINAGGYFDAGDAAEGEVTDSKAVACLISRSHTDCAGAPVTVQELLAQTGASLALLDYYWPPETAYADEAASADCPEGEATCYAAQGVYNFQARKLDYMDCGTRAVLSEAGYYGFVVASEVDRYTIEPASLAYRKLTSYLAPIENTAAATLQIPFSWQMELTPSEAMLARNHVIDPIDGSRLIQPALLGPHMLAPLEEVMQCNPLEVTLQAVQSGYGAAASGGWGPYNYEWSFTPGEGVTGLFLSQDAGNSSQLQGTATGGNPAGICGTISVLARDSQLPTSATATADTVVTGCGLAPQPSVMAAAIRSRLLTDGNIYRLNFTVSRTGEIVGYQRDHLWGYIDSPHVVMGQSYAASNPNSPLETHTLAIAGGAGPHYAPIFHHVSGDQFTFDLIDYRNVSGRLCNQTQLTCYSLPSFYANFIRMLPSDIALIYGDEHCRCDDFYPYKVVANLPISGDGTAGWAVTPKAVNRPAVSAPRSGLYEVEVVDAAGNALRFPLRVHAEVY